MVDQMLIAEYPEEKSQEQNNESESGDSKSKSQLKYRKFAVSPPSKYIAKENFKRTSITNLRSIFKNIPIQDIDADSVNRKSISIDGQVYKTIKQMKTSLSQRSHGRITFNMVVQSLIQDHVDLQNLRSELELIKKEMEDTQNYLKEMLKLALTNSKPQIQYIPISNQFVSPNPPPPAVSQGIPKRINYKPPNTGNLMRDYVKEIKQLFRGEILRPSDVVGITQVKHKDSPIKQLAEDCLIPDIELVSAAKNFKPILEEESNV